MASQTAAGPTGHICCAGCARKLGHAPLEEVQILVVACLVAASARQKAASRAIDGKGSRAERSSGAEHCMHCVLCSCKHRSARLPHAPLAASSACLAALAACPWVVDLHVQAQRQAEQQAASAWPVAGSTAQGCVQQGDSAAQWLQRTCTAPWMVRCCGQGVSLREAGKALPTQHMPVHRTSRWRHARHGSTGWSHHRCC